MNFGIKTTLEIRRRELLFIEINTRKRKKEPLELIVNVESKKKEKAARELDRIGKVTRIFKYIPYVSFLCSAEDAERIANSFYNGVYDRAFSAIAIRALDLSHTFFAFGKKEAKGGWWGDWKAGSSGNLKSYKGKVKTQNQWNLENIGVYEAWNYSKGKGAKIAIIDTGVNYNHPELRSRFTSKKGYDFVRDNEDPIDENGHGTHVAGIAASINYGVATEATLYSVRVLDEKGSGSDANVAAGIEWCLDNGIDIANMSLGGPSASKALVEICNIAYKRGLILVAAAGNTGDVKANYPAAFGESVIAVAAVDKNNKHADFSTIYPTNDISAPGVKITAPYLDSYAELSGTSMATPHISGVLALGISLSKEKNLEELLKATAHKLDSDLPYNNNWIFGSGLVAADEMMEGVVENFYSIINRYISGNKRRNLARAAIAARKIWEF